MKTIQILASGAALLTAFAHAAPQYNGTVKGTVDGKRIDVKTVCEREKMGTSELLQVNSDPGGRGEIKDRNGDGVAVEVGINLTSSVAGFVVLVGGRTYEFGKMGGLTLSPTGMAIKGRFEPMQKEPEHHKAFDVDLTVDCP